MEGTGIDSEDEDVVDGPGMRDWNILNEDGRVELGPGKWTKARSGRVLWTQRVCFLLYFESQAIGFKQANDLI